MFDFFRRHTRVLQFLLVLLIFPSFVFFGIQGYSRFDGGDQQTVAKVAGQSVTQAELDDAHARARRSRAAPDAEPRCQAVRDAGDEGAGARRRDPRPARCWSPPTSCTSTMTDERLDRAFKSDPEFAPLRNPDGSVNRDTLTALGMSSEVFAERLRQDLSRRQVLQPSAHSAIAPAAAGVGRARGDVPAARGPGRALRRQGPARQGGSRPTPRSRRTTRIRRTPAQFQAPEQAAVEYVVLDLESVKKDIAVSEDDLRKYYAENEKRYTSAEERRASHILVKADKDAPKAERDKARAKAEGLLAEVRKNPQAFAEIARKNSDDEGSAAKGGDLDFFGRGAIAKPFEDAAFALKPGETSGVVESDFGFHIIQVTGARGGEKKSFESVRAGIEAEVRNQLAQKRFADAAVEFGDTVYEQPESLKPAADKWKLEIATAQRVTRTPAPGASGAARQSALPRGAVQQRVRLATSATPRRSTSARTSSPPAASSSTRRRTSCRSPR